ncbi:replication-associated recombination protein A [Lactobacillus intestinalis]|uniref:replication-associated recombination protein A n=1 Tax=Lactobacillus intestinalis TaxID=151781 RepID=UPI0026ECC17F|nr:replication-associated recombination protein A [Lactobacillus intestinalis]
MTIRKPLADQLRPRTLSEVAGQKDLLAKGKPLQKIIENHVLVSLVLWGPPGTGKSTLAQIIAQKFGYHFEKINASVDNKAQLVKIINNYPDQTFVLLIDEIHRMTKTLQDFLLPYLENGHIMLIGATTENPIMSLVPAVRSRCQIFEFKPLKDDEVAQVVKRAVKELYSDDAKISSEGIKLIAIAAKGDLRVALNILETLHAINPQTLKIEDVKNFTKSQNFSYDRKATKHYDYLAAYSDSMAGSDTDAALYYLAILLKNSDLPSVVRRLREIPYTYIGLANPVQVTQIVIAANQAEKVGMPKAIYPLMFATMLMCLSPKSGSFDKIWQELDHDTAHPNQHPMPRGLRDMHYKHSEKITGGGLIKSPFEEPFQVAKQNYMPKGLEGKRYYFAKDNLNEKKLEEQYLKLHKYIYGEDYRNK